MLKIWKKGADGIFTQTPFCTFWPRGFSKQKRKMTAYSRDTLKLYCTKASVVPS